MPPTPFHRATGPVRVLVIEDEESARRAIGQGLREEGFRVDEAADGAAGLEAAIEAAPDVVLLDLRLRKKLGQSLITTRRGQGFIVDA